MKFMIKFALIVSIVIGLVACGQIREVIGEEVTKRSSEADQVPDITPQEVILKAGETMQEWNGIHYIMDLNQQMKMPGMVVKPNNSENMTLDMKLTLEPFAVRMSGMKQFGRGEVEPIEMFYVDETMYVEYSANEWLSLKDTVVYDEFQTQNPIQTIKGTIELLDIVSAEDSESIIDLKEKDDLYIVIIKMAENEAQKATEMVMGHTTNQLEHMRDMNFMEEILIEKMEMAFLIDKKTFELKEMKQIVTTKYIEQNGTTTLDTDFDIKIRREIEGRIDIPKEIEGIAEEISAEELEQLQ